ncbi:SOS response-associated peptidase [Salipaludibacillus daqingensis]|uniref:SOS response-associated peptidase n=1 Tax=Salipaludibacillus daqingensis TaxID=3041001 RepID=UPI0024732F4C|nr:SOS response-associated peptidase [Salipaludibacillus daqingensis]
MCGRFSLSKIDGLDERFAIAQDFLPDQMEVSYNIAPSQQILSVIHDGNKRRMGHLRWGLIPRWAKDEKIGYKLMNARAESLAEKPSFKKAFQTQRCLIIADGFYEWKKQGGEKQPYRMTLKDEEPFAFAGLWEKWRSPSGHQVFSCTIITTEANPLLRDIHDRMPVILKQQDEAAWLDPNQTDTSELEHLLQPFPDEDMTAYPVSQQVNSPKNNRPELIERISL